MNRMLKEVKRRIKAVYRWHQEGRFWRQTKIKLFTDCGGFKLFFPFSYFVKIKPNKIVCVSYFGIYHSGNPACIVDRVKEMNNDVEIVWLVDKRSNNYPVSYLEKTVDIYSFRAMYELASAKIWIDNARKNVYVPKKKDQFYLQTWHGGVALKKIEGDAENSLSKRYMKIAKMDSTNTDLMLSNSKFCTDMYRRAFWYNGIVLEKGLPRNDVIFKHPDFNTDQIREKIGVSKGHKLLLYAPTFRKSQEDFPYITDFSEIVNCLERKLGESVTVIVKHHPNIRKIVKNISYKGQVVDCTEYADIQDLFLLSDYLITDYSSTMFEFGMLKRPVFLYVNDWESYKKKDREFYFSFEELPFPCAYSTKELLEKLRLFDEASYEKELKTFFDHIGLCETGNATEAAASYVVSQLGERLK